MRIKHADKTNKNKTKNVMIPNMMMCYTRREMLYDKTTKNKKCDDIKYDDIKREEKHADKTKRNKKFDDIKYDDIVREEKYTRRKICRVFTASSRELSIVEEKEEFHYHQNTKTSNNKKKSWCLTR